MRVHVVRSVFVLRTYTAGKSSKHQQHEKPRVRHLYAAARVALCFAKLRQCCGQPSVRRKPQAMKTKREDELQKERHVCPEANKPFIVDTSLSCR
ncbi:hypothetical protein HU200_060557 [Digitaria exilis]|uniref:Uncharacterized protein n=1 Tax=Digitaria exilis TaxID=1010633 RepID=A0A835E1K8_9POAL|nr:hypothetical protein HU200_060557 [Digitaria exilis]